jgi:hypothetical protein
MIFREAGAGRAGSTKKGTVTPMRTKATVLKLFGITSIRALYTRNFYLTTGILMTRNFFFTSVKKFVQICSE